MQENSTLLIQVYYFKKIRFTFSLLKRN